MPTQSATVVNSHLSSRPLSRLNKIRPISSSARLAFRRPSSFCKSVPDDLMYPIAKCHTKAIEDVQVGDLVWSWDETTKRVVKRPVKRLFRRHDKHILTVEIEAADCSRHNIVATTEHPFWVEGRGWIAADQLQSGDTLKGINAGIAVRVISVRCRGEQADVYNFEVRETHNYFAGPNGVMVHNESVLSDGLPLVSPLAANPRASNYQHLLRQMATGKVLYIANGDHTLARVAAESVPGTIPTRMVSTDIVHIHATAETRFKSTRNTAILELGGARVHPADATDLRATFGDERFDTIIAMGPYLNPRAGNSNQQFVRKVFASAKKQLQIGGEMVVGLYGDQQKNWRVFEQASELGMIPLHDGVPVDLSQFPGFNPLESDFFPNHKNIRAGMVAYTFVVDEHFGKPKSK